MRCDDVRWLGGVLCRWWVSLCFADFWWFSSVFGEFSFASQSFITLISLLFRYRYVTHHSASLTFTDDLDLLRLSLWVCLSVVFLCAAFLSWGTCAGHQQAPGVQIITRMLNTAYGMVYERKNRCSHITGIKTQESSIDVFSELCLMWLFLWTLTDELVHIYSCRETLTLRSCAYIVLLSTSDVRD